MMALFSALHNTVCNKWCVLFPIGMYNLYSFQILVKLHFLKLVYL